MGFKIRDAHKSSNFHEPTFDAILPLPHWHRLSSFVGSTANPDPGYYFGNYKILPLSNFDKILSYFNANRGLFKEATDFEHLISDSNDYTLGNGSSPATFRTRLLSDT